jgi:hypothetical protein
MGWCVYAPGGICTLYLKCILNIYKNVKKNTCILYLKWILNIFKNVKKYKTMSRVYLNMLHVHKIVSAKVDMFSALCKNTNIAQNTVLCETLYAHIGHVSLYRIFFLNFF